MSSSRDYFIKAQKYHNKGQINKAVEYCEKAISEDIKNAEALNLKGFLHYYLGDIESAKAVWRTNKDFNNDLLAKGYLGNLSDEEKLLKLYVEANKYIQEYKIKEALVLLEQCKESSFNTINVNCSLAKCYAYMGRNEDAKKALNRVFQLDKNNEFGKEINKSLIDFDNKGGSNKLMYGVVFLVIVLIIGSSIPVINIYNKKKNESSISTDKKDEIVLEDAKESEEPEEVVEENKETEQVQKEESKEVFPSEEFNQGIASKDYSKLHSLNQAWKNKDANLLTAEDKVLLSKSEEILKSEGVPELYERGLDYMDIDDSVKAIEVFNIALAYSDGSYLREHILYFISSCYLNQKDTDNSIKVSEDYYNAYREGVYIQQVLYNLALLYKDRDITKAKNYANEIITKHPDSQFNNETVKNIANS